MDCSMPGFPVLDHLPKFAQTHFHWVDDAIQPSHPLLPPSSPAFNLSQHHGLFRWVSSSRWPKYGSLNFSISLSSEYPGFISFRNDWFDLLAVQRAFKSLLQHHKSINSLALSFLYGPTHILTWLLEKLRLWLHRSLLAKWCLCVC